MEQERMIMEQERMIMHPKYDGRTGEVTLIGNPSNIKFSDLTHFYRFWAWHEEYDVVMELYNTEEGLINIIRQQNSRMREALHA